MAPSMTSRTLTLQWVATVLLWLRSMDLRAGRPRRYDDHKPFIF